MSTDYYWRYQERIRDDFVTLVDDWRANPEVFVTFDQIETELERANENTHVHKNTYAQMQQYWDDTKFADQMTPEHPDRSLFNRGIFDATLAPFFKEEVY